MTELAQRLLDLQDEYQRIELTANVASEFGQPEWAPRTKEQIAADYAVALREFIAAA